ncbi:response regulator [Flavobacterium zepuense]|uniref:Response regulator n=1 Tax=Flavobacterium zepuense TaxID=2593302 RepID=A0A552V024_9FLAO|nr:response regulator [Flavobacterium zepuense]TRW23831.1 response regulator [Flavobacterium zepuense]
MTPISCIMLIDDNKIDNFFHERVIRKNNAAEIIITKESAIEALAYLKQGNEVIQPNLIILDINMPGMNGWEFLAEYKKIDLDIKNIMVVVMLSVSEDPTNEALALTKGIWATFKSKPVTKEMLEGLDVLYTNHLVQDTEAINSQNIQRHQ